MTDSSKFEPNAKYNEYCPRWQKMDDVIDGGPKLQQRDLEKRGTYLREINPDDLSLYNRNRNINYIRGVRFFNATARTLSGLMGMLFRVDPVDQDIPSELEYLKSNADGAGMPLDQQAQATSSHVIQQGRYFLLADMPVKDFEGETSKADVAGGFRPRIATYNACSVIDWHQSVINNSMMLDLVVIEETVSQFIDDDMIKREDVKQHRVLRLIEGVYSQQLYIDDVAQDIVFPTKGDGSTWNIIPGIFVGSTNNNPDIDSLPLEPIADVNLGHYQNSADLESSSFQLSAAQPWIADDNYAQQVNNVDDKGEKTQTFGEDTLIILGSGGTFNIAQPSPNTLAKELASDKREEMAQLGAQLISDGGQAETAEAVRIKKASDASVLDLIAENVSAGYNQAISLCSPSFRRSSNTWFLTWMLTS